jgi:hypothetical protein
MSHKDDAQCILVFFMCMEVLKIQIATPSVPKYKDLLTSANHV